MRSPLFRVRSLLYLRRQPAQLRIHEARNLRRAVEVAQRLERADDVAEGAAVDRALAVVDVDLAEEVVGQVDVAALDAGGGDQDVDRLLAVRRVVEPVDAA